MSNARVLQRIGAWEADGLIDHATAARLREAEGREPPDETSAPAGGPAPARTGVLGPAITPTELFAFLGAGFALAAWYAFIGTSASLDSLGMAGLVAGVALALVAVPLARGDARWRRAAGAALMVAVPNFGAGAWLLLNEVRPEAYGDVPTNAVIATLLAAAVAFGSRWFVPALTTQLALALATAAAGVALMGWLDGVLFPSTTVDEWEQAPLDPTAAMVRVVLSMAWWWLVALVMAVLLVVLDRAPGAGPRHTLGRIAVGLTAVTGTAFAVFQRHAWNAPQAYAGEAVLEPVLGALVLVAVSGFLVILAMFRSDPAYLWPGGLGVFTALTWLNAEYVVGQTGLAAALFVEAVALFACALGVRAFMVRIRRAEPPPGPAAPPAPPPVVPPVAS